MKSMRSISFIIFSLFLSSCSIITYDIRNELPEVENGESCKIAFTLDLQSGHSTNSFGNQAHENEVLKELEENYIKTTLNTLNSLGCSSKQAKNISESNFTINVSRQLQLSALPQEWLTGLSLGLIPSWGTKYSQYVFTFTHEGSGKTHSYQIDQNNYNHLILFPVFWVTFFTTDEQRAYTNALTNFIKSS